MHANEGRPFFIIVTGKIGVVEEDEHEEPKLTISEVYEIVTKSLEASGARVVFKDSTGGVYEISGRLVSDASKAYLLVGYSWGSIPVILVMEDLLYPFRDWEKIRGEERGAVEFFFKFMDKILPEKYRGLIGIDIVDVRSMDAPFSLDMVEEVPYR